MNLSGPCKCDCHPKGYQSCDKCFSYHYAPEAPAVMHYEREIHQLKKRLEQIEAYFPKERISDIELNLANMALRVDAEIEVLNTKFEDLTAKSVHNHSKPLFKSQICDCCDGTGRVTR